LAADIEQIFGIKSTLIEGHGGIFEVWVNDTIIYSNHNECCQQFIPESVIRDVGKAISSNKLPINKYSRKSEGG
jgi:predicted Rdx family selenoprotein